MTNNKIMIDSPYTYLENVPMVMQNIPKWQADLNKLFKDGTYGKVEYSIIEALSIFHYMNSYNLSRYLNKKLQDRKWADYSNIIKKLQADNVICKNTYGKQIFYSLFPDAERYMKKRRGKKATEGCYAPEPTPEGILECAALAQWHLAATRGNVSSSCFYRKMRIAKVNINMASYIDRKIGRYYYRIFSLPFPKNRKNDIAVFFNQLKNTWYVMGKCRGRNQINLTVIVVSSLKEIKTITQLLNTIDEAKERNIYFALEGNTAEFDGLSCLYYYEKNSTETEDSIKTISIRE